MVKNQLEISDIKQQIRLWFECYQICHSIDKYKDNLNSTKTQNFYKDWGDVVGITFNDWWSEKSYLFEDLKVVEVTKIKKSSNTIHLSIPLSQPSSKSIKQIKEILNTKKTEKTPNKSKYRFTSKRLKGIKLYETIEIYKLYMKLNYPPINIDFLREIRISFENRRGLLRRYIYNIPQLDEYDRLSNVDVEDICDVYRRSLRRLERTLDNVSKCRFP